MEILSLQRLSLREILKHNKKGSNTECYAMQSELHQLHHSKGSRRTTTNEGQIVAACIYRFPDIKIGIETFYESYKSDVKLTNERIERMMSSRFVKPDVFSYHLKDLQEKSYGGEGFRNARNCKGCRKEEKRWRRDFRLEIREGTVQAIYNEAGNLIYPWEEISELEDEILCTKCRLIYRKTLMLD